MAKPIESHKQRHAIAHSSCLMPKISAKFQQEITQMGAPNEVGWVQIGDFRQISRYISETVQEDLVPGSNRNSYARMALFSMTLGDH